MADIQPADIRIGDSERETALTALGEHMSAGRLDIDEYGDRTAKVATAKTRGELLALFTDLPEPHPRFGTVTAPPSPAPVPQAVPASVPMPAGRPMPVGQRLFAALTPLAAIVAVGLFFATHLWWFFLLVPAIGIIGGALWGEDHKRHKMVAREEWRAQRREIRRRGRGW